MRQTFPERPTERAPVCVCADYRRVGVEWGAGRHECIWYSAVPSIYLSAGCLVWSGLLVVSPCVLPRGLNWRSRQTVHVCACIFVVVVVDGCGLQEGESMCVCMWMRACLGCVCMAVTSDQDIKTNCKKWSLVHRYRCFIWQHSSASICCLNLLLQYNYDSCQAFVNCFRVTQSVLFQRCQSTRRGV